MARVADLHMHTTASDGTDGLSKRVDDARKKGLDCIAVTDHDTLNPGLDGLVTEMDGVEVLSGVEVKCELEGRRLEILGYLVDPSSGRLSRLCERNRANRRRRVREMVDRLGEAFGIDVSFDDVASRADGSLGRPHIAEELVDRGEASSVSDAFDLYIGRDGPVYVPGERPDAETVIDAIHGAGGVASLAHPGRVFPREAFPEAVERLASMGLDALEVFYSYDEHRRETNTRIFFDEELAREMAEEHGLLQTGGSDCHGSGSEKYFLGGVRLPYRHVERLKEKRKEYVGEAV